MGMVFHNGKNVRGVKRLKNEQHKGLSAAGKCRFILWGRTPSQLSGTRPTKRDENNHLNIKQIKTSQRRTEQKCPNFSNRMKQVVLRIKN